MLDDEIEWIRQGLKRPGKTQRGLAKALGVDAAAVNRLLKGERQMKAREAKIIRAYLAEDGQAGAAEAAMGKRKAEPEANIVLVPEYDVRVSAGGGFYVETETIKAQWPFDRGYLRELHVAVGQAVVIEVQGDSMEPTLRSGDRVLVDLSDRNPAQPGIFVLWDTDRTVVKRVEKVPASKPPELVLISDNKLHHEYRVLAELARIIGRVVWRATRM